MVLVSTGSTVNARLFRYHQYVPLKIVPLGTAIMFQQVTLVCTNISSITRNHQYVPLQVESQGTTSKYHQEPLVSTTRNHQYVPLGTTSMYHQEPLVCTIKYYYHVPRSTTSMYHCKQYNQEPLVCTTVRSSTTIVCTIKGQGQVRSVVSYLVHARWGVVHGLVMEPVVVLKAIISVVQVLKRLMIE